MIARDVDTPDPIADVNAEDEEDEEPPSPSQPRSACTRCILLATTVQLDKRPRLSMIARQTGQVRG
ncbi:hypothetical protein F5890DRAFT_1560572 [Lentinula detonsa]|uniref:Uncharacterized protein n=1 Tax=Lentinula detonsa TaxID=2804962 RepID=A0AA38PNC8_9AGAR|nr:hypothetical protein F5890DRAFT_1560572 [Lentinula detonsa]